LQELYRQVVRVNEEMRHEFGRQPTVPELAARLEVEPGDVLEAMEIGSAQTPSSLDATVGGEDERVAANLGDTIGDLDPNLQQVETGDLLSRAMANLTDRERKIMVMRFVDELSQSEVAERLGISQMHVSRLQRAAQEQLRSLLTAEAASP
ncbi:MAG: sigma-70 family RNA polymerase sigma factor, partial [Candidatus Dormibacteraceae bacterium]